jgi:hypothetical protein
MIAWAVTLLPGRSPTTASLAALSVNDTPSRPDDAVLIAERDREILDRQERPVRLAGLLHFFRVDHPRTRGSTTA